VSPLSILASGFAIDALGFAGAYAVALLGPLVDLSAVSRIARRGPTVRVARAQRLLRATYDDVRAGLAYARGERVVFWAIALVLATYVLGFPAVANLGPTWVTTVVGVPYRLFGLVATTWGIGGVIGGLLLTRYAHVPRKGALLVCGALGFAAAFALFAFGKTPAAATVGNFGLGLSVATVQISSIALLQHLAPDAIRGRVMSLLQIGMGTAQLATLPVAALGQAIGLEVLFPALALAQLATVGSIALLQPALRRARG
jgi:predicted MFS family arabinose efflux permease